MSKFPSALWLNVSPSFRVFDKPLLRHLSCQTSIARWEYRQTQDEASSLTVAIALLHDYLKINPSPIHLLGHGTSGLLGLLYAQQHPERVASLTLLSVGPQVAIDWQVYYYAHLNSLPCGRDMVLRQMVYSLFGYQSSLMIQSMVEILEDDLRYSPSPHSLMHRSAKFNQQCNVPMLVCASEDDGVVPSDEFQRWRNWLGDNDVLWQCQSGRHFFHYVHSRLSSKQILNFWSSLSHCNSTADRANSLDVAPLADLFIVP